MKKAMIFVLNLFIMYFLSTSIASALQDAYELRFEEDEGGVVITYCMLNKPVDQFVLPESINGKPVIAIASYAFSSFESADPEYYAQEIILPDTIQVIEDYAMNEIRNVSKIHLPQSLEDIGVHALPNGYLCTAEWYPATGKYEFNNGFIIDTSTQTAIHCFSSSPHAVAIPDGIVELCDGLFAGWPLEKVLFPESLRIIGSGAFYECDQLTNLTFPGNLLVIESYAFGLCSRISKLAFPSTLLYIGEKAFHQQSLSDYGSLSELILNDGLIYIGNYCFAEHQLQTVIVPSSVVYVGEGAFESSFTETQFIGYEEPEW